MHGGRVLFITPCEVCNLIYVHRCCLFRVQPASSMVYTMLFIHFMITMVSMTVSKQRNLTKDSCTKQNQKYAALPSLFPIGNKCTVWFVPVPIHLLTWFATISNRVARARTRCLKILFTAIAKLGL